MKTIIITGPSGSGKSYLSKKLSKLFNNTIVLKTDSYYKDNIFIRFLSIFQHDIYDRPLSIKKKEIKRILKSLDYEEEEINNALVYAETKHPTDNPSAEITPNDENNPILNEWLKASLVWLSKDSL